MDKQQIINNLRQLAENEYHSKLRNIEAEVNESYHRYQMEVLLIDQAEQHCRAGFEVMRKEAAARNGLLLESGSINQEQPA